jgi:hypothetical protein
MGRRVGCWSLVSKRLSRVQISNTTTNLYKKKKNKNRYNSQGNKKQHSINHSFRQCRAAAAAPAITSIFIRELYKSTPLHCWLLHVSKCRPILSRMDEINTLKIFLNQSKLHRRMKSRTSIGQTWIHHKKSKTKKKKIWNENCVKVIHATTGQS